MHEVKAQGVLSDCDAAAIQVAACKLQAKPTTCIMPTTVKVGQVACITQGGQLVSKVTSPIVAIRYGFDDGTFRYQNIKEPTTVVMSPPLLPKFLDGKAHVITLQAYSDSINYLPFDKFFAFTFKKLP